MPIVSVFLEVYAQLLHFLSSFTASTILLGKKKGTANFELLPSHIIINILRGLLRNKPLFFF
jgi:hypothetical protein